MMPCTGSGCECSPSLRSSATPGPPAGPWGSTPPRSTGGVSSCSGSARRSCVRGSAGGLGWPTRPLRSWSSGWWPSLSATPGSGRPGAKTTYGYSDGIHMDSMVEPRGYVSGNNPSDYTSSYAYNNADQLTTLKDPLDVGDPGHHTVT